MRAILEMRSILVGWVRTKTHFWPSGSKSACRIQYWILDTAGNLRNEKRQLELTRVCHAEAALCVDSARAARHARCKASLYPLETRRTPRPSAVEVTAAAVAAAAAPGPQLQRPHSKLVGPSWQRGKTTTVTFSSSSAGSGARILEAVRLVWQVLPAHNRRPALACTTLG